MLGLFSLVIPAFSYAYLDLGTGSYMFQILIAFVLGGLFTVKQYFRQIRDFISGLFFRKKNDSFDEQK